MSNTDEKSTEQWEEPSTAESIANQAAFEAGYAGIPADHDDLTTSKVISEQRPTPETAQHKIRQRRERLHIEVTRELIWQQLEDSNAKLEQFERQRDEAREDSKLIMGAHDRAVLAFREVAVDLSEARAQRDEAAARDPWQTIDSAPEEEELIVTDWEHIAFSEKAPRDGGGFYWAQEGDGGLDWEPTHWMPKNFARIGKESV